MLTSNDFDFSTVVMPIIGSDLQEIGVDGPIFFRFYLGIFAFITYLKVILDLLPRILSKCAMHI